MKFATMNRAPKTGRAHAELFVSIFVLAVMVFFNASNSRAEPTTSIDEALVRAVLSGDWNRVADSHLAYVNTETPSPVLRLIKAHACLALNRNDESACLFAASLSHEDLKTWNEWAEGFLRNHPNSQTASYFRGDASARRGEWVQASASFARALEAREDHTRAMVLNARALVSAAQRRFDPALVDLSKAIVLRPDLADAHANLGFLAILQKEGAKGALRDFDMAISVSPDFSLARYGKGCIHMILGELSPAETEFDLSLMKPNCLGERLYEKIQTALNLLNEQGPIELASADTENPGFYIESSMRAMDRNDLGWMGATYKEGLKNALRMGETAISNYEKATTSLIQREPKLAPYISKYNNQVRTEIAMTAMAQKYELGLSRGLDIKIGSPDQKKPLNMTTGFTSQERITYDLSAARPKAFESLGNFQKFETGLSRHAPGYTSRPQGFDSGPSHGTIDEGAWPDLAEFGLLYPVN
jgi:tetratricopeptide (TPR) repeat protein